MNIDIEELNKTILDGNVARAIAIINHNPDFINQRDNRGYTPIMYATHLGDKHFLEFLLDKGADINVKNSNGIPNPLIYAVSVKENVDTVAFLLKHGADPNIKCQYKKPPLIRASYEGNIEIVMLLIDTGANINIKGYGKRTPLMYAFLGKKYDVMELLLKNDANPYLKGKHKKSSVYDSIAWQRDKPTFKEIFKLIDNSPHTIDIGRAAPTDSLTPPEFNIL